MSRRAPTSLLLLIDRRNRLSDELAKLRRLKAEAALLYRHVKLQLDGVDTALSKHPIQLDADILDPQSTYRARAAGTRGDMGKAILGALRDASGQPLTAPDVLDWMEARWPEGTDRPTNRREWLRKVSRRMRHMREQGTLLSPSIGDGGATSTTWIVNPDWLESLGRGTESTPPAADSPDSSD